MIVFEIFEVNYENIAILGLVLANNNSFNKNFKIYKTFILKFQIEFSFPLLENFEDFAFVLRKNFAYKFEFKF